MPGRSKARARGSCLARECVAEQSACDADPTCAHEMQCELQCRKGDLACTSACAGRYAVGLRGAEYWNLLTCRAEHCAEGCGLPCDGVCTDHDACDACVSTQCQHLATSMLASSEAASRLQCKASSDALFVGLDAGDCDATVHDGDEVTAWTACLTGTCANACGFGSAAPDWRCVGQISRELPASLPAAIEFDVRVTSDFVLTPAIGVLVSACQLGSGACEPALPTDRSGITRLSVKRTTTGKLFDYLEITDPSGISDPTLFVERPPLLQNGARLFAVALNKQVLDGFYAQGGAIFDRTRYGQVAILMRSCGMVAAGSGVSSRDAATT